MINAFNIINYAQCNECFGAARTAILCIEICISLFYIDICVIFLPSSTLIKYISISQMNEWIDNKRNVYILREDEAE